ILDVDVTHHNPHSFPTRRSSDLQNLYPMRNTIALIKVESKIQDKIMSTDNIEGKVVVITGASSGLGKIMAEYLSDRGAKGSFRSAKYRQDRSFSRFH